MDAEPKKRFHTITVTVVLLLLFLAYPLSYAPAIRLGLRPHNGSIAVYKPVEWLNDETPLREPLLMWADVWGVRKWVAIFHYKRVLQRADLDLWMP